MKFLRKSKVVEAEFFDGTEQSAIAIAHWSGHEVRMILLYTSISLEMETKYGPASCEADTWVIRGSCGKYYPCSIRDFHDNYESISQ